MSAIAVAHRSRNDDANASCRTTATIPLKNSLGALRPAQSVTGSTVVRRGTRVKIEGMNSGFAENPRNKLWRRIFFLTWCEFRQQDTHPWHISLCQSTTQKDGLWHSGNLHLAVSYCLMMQGIVYGHSFVPRWRPGAYNSNRSLTYCPSHQPMWLVHLCR